MSTQQLLQILQFGPVAPGATVPLPHNININGVPQTPDLVMCDQAGVRLFADEDHVEFTNNTGENIAQAFVWLELKHSIPRQLGKAFGNPFDGMTPRPFIPSSSSDRFPFMEAHVTQLSTRTYNVTNVVHTPAGIYDIFLITPVPGPLFTEGAVTTLGVEVVSPNPPGIATYEWMNPGQLRVSTWDLSGALVDTFGFSVNVSLVTRNF